MEIKMTDQATPIRKPRKPRSTVQLLLSISDMAGTDAFKVFHQLATTTDFVSADYRAAAKKILENLEVLKNGGNKIKKLATEAVA